MVGDKKRRSNTEKKDVAFFEGSDFHHVQAHLSASRQLYRVQCSNKER